MRPGLRLDVPVRDDDGPLQRHRRDRQQLERLVRRRRRRLDRSQLDAAGHDRRRGDGRVRAPSSPTPSASATRSIPPRTSRACLPPARRSRSGRRASRATPATPPATRRPARSRRRPRQHRSQPDAAGHDRRRGDGPSGAVVSFTVDRRPTPVDRRPTPTCSPASGSTFPLGTTTRELHRQRRAGTRSDWLVQRHRPRHDRPVLVGVPGDNR